MKKLLSLFLLILLLFLPIFNKFTITNGSTNNLVFVGGLKDFENFDVDFTHSVNKTPVKEFYKIVDRSFNLYKAEFFSYGAGMSDGNDLDKAKISHGENNEIYLDLDEGFEIITYYVGTVADHRLNYKDKTIHFNQLLKAQSPAVLQVKKVSIYEILKANVLKNIISKNS